jgi:hypothetical protein
MAVLHDRMFIALTTLEAWMDSGQVDMGDRTVTLNKRKCTYDLEPAVRFISVVSGSPAPRLLGRVLTEDRIGELGGELMGDSVILGETAFQVQPGYVGTLRREARAQAHGPE